eukprot:TRINITY_DN7225_c0_g1_i5.p1 TRINITY_DN7225_c0_g1~~TRINITY_DN7225_c0_g1_i5.p1  ORF type:complete len:140 (+),score=9.95 TRINITY_DN7225_c0_g1_i5:163-582(+)
MKALFLISFIFFSFLPVINTQEIDNGDCGICGSCINQTNGNIETTGCCGQNFTNPITGASEQACMTFCLLEYRTCCGCNFRRSTHPDNACFGCLKQDVCTASNNTLSDLDRICVSDASSVLHQIFVLFATFAVAVVLLV